MFLTKGHSEKKPTKPFVRLVSSGRTHQMLHVDRHSFCWFLIWVSNDRCHIYTFSHRRYDHLIFFHQSKHLHTIQSSFWSQRWPVRFGVTPHHKDLLFIFSPEYHRSQRAHIGLSSIRCASDCMSWSYILPNVSHQLALVVKVAADVGWGPTTHLEEKRINAAQTINSSLHYVLPCHIPLCNYMYFVRGNAINLQPTWIG